MLNLRRLGEGQDEWLNALQLLAPVLDPLVAELSTTIDGADQPVAEIRRVELNWRKTADVVDVELEGDSSVIMWRTVMLNAYPPVV